MLSADSASTILWLADPGDMRIGQPVIVLVPAVGDENLLLNEREFSSPYVADSSKRPAAREGVDG